MWTARKRPPVQRHEAAGACPVSRSDSGPDDVEAGKTTLERADRIRAPPALERGGIEVAEIDREGQVAVAVEAAQRGRGAVQPAFHPATRHEMGACGAVVGPIGLVLARTPTEL